MFCKNMFCKNIFCKNIIIENTCIWDGNKIISSFVNGHGEHQLAPPRFWDEDEKKII